MKKMISLLLLTFTIVSCGAKSKEINKNDTIQNNNTMKTVQLTKEDFLTKVANYETNPQEWVYLGEKPAIIDFYADWCGPCKMVSPILEELAGEYSEDIIIYKVDTEVEQELAAAFGIRSIPSILFIPMEGSPQMAQGALPKATLKEAINEVLLNKN